MIPFNNDRIILSIFSTFSTFAKAPRPKMTSFEQPQILLLGLAAKSSLDEWFKSLFDCVGKSAQLKRENSIDGAIRYLEDNSPKAILATDEGLAETESRPVLEKVLSYLRNGGMVILGLHFPLDFDVNQFDNFFELFGLPWKLGDYHVEQVQFNPFCTLPSTVVKDSIPSVYLLLARRIMGARQEEKIVIPAPRTKKDSLDSHWRHIDQAQAALAGAKVGNGFLVHAGGVGPEKDSINVILALCGMR